MVFWGVLVAVAIGVLTGGLFNGVLGYALIAIGMVGLAKNSVGSRGGLPIKLVAIVALLDAFWAPFADCPCRISLAEKIVGVALGILNALAAVGFCVAIRRLCEMIPLERAQQSWRRSIFLWRVGLPVSLGATCLGWWAVRDDRGLISATNTPTFVGVPLVALLLIALIAWIHSFVSLGRTIAGLKHMVKRLPAASAFGLDRQPLFHFSIRALLIVAAAAALIAAGVSQKTILCWQVTMAGLVGLSLLATWLNHRTLCKGLLVVVAAVLLAGYTQLTKHSQAGRICGTTAESGYLDADYRLSDSFLADIDGWLATRGYERSEPPDDSANLFTPALRSNDPPFASEPKTAIWYSGARSTPQAVKVRVLYSKIGQYLHYVAVDYDWVVVDFPSTNRKREKDLKKFVDETAAMWQEYLERQRKDRPKP
jgi:hypothetical protein